MKKSITILLLAMLMGVTTATAEDLYVYVAGKKLNVSTNYTNVTEGLVSGSYTFYSSSKRLVLNNVTIERDGTNKNAIDSNLPGLRIEFVGTTNIKTGDDALALRSSTDMYGQGTLSITSTSGMAVHIFDASAVSFRGGNWTLNGKGGIVGKTNDGNKIVSFYDNVANYPFALSANGSDGSIWDVKVYFYNNLSICNPIDAYYNSSTLAICPTGSTSRVKGEDVIIGIPAFQLGNKGYATNQTEIKGSNITLGTVTYNHSTKTVTMDYANVKGGPFVPLLDNMTLYLNHRNTIESNSSLASIKSSKNLTIRCSNGGVLYAYGTINLVNSGTPPKLLFKDADVYVNPNTDCYGINCPDGSAIVEFDNSSVELNASSSAKSIHAKVKMTNSHIEKPVGVVKVSSTTNNVVFDNSEAGLLYDINTGDDRKGLLTIGRGAPYNLWVCGVQVNKDNRDKLSELMDAGQCTFSKSGVPTLTLNKVTMNSHWIVPFTIYNLESGLVINLEGGTSLINSSAKQAGIYSEADFTINGNNMELQVFSSQDTQPLAFENATMTVNNANRLYAKGGHYGIYTGTGCVKLNNSYLYLYGTESALYCINFDPDESGYITNPVGGVHLGFGVVDPIHANTIAKEVNIVPVGDKYNLWLNGRQVNERNCSNLNHLFTDATGTISFNPNSNKLTLNNFQATQGNNDDKAIINSKLNNLELNLTGTNSISANTGDAMTSTESVTVTGTGSLDLSAKGNGVFVRDLTIKDHATLKARGEAYGVYATNHLTMNPGTELSGYASSSDGYSFCTYSKPTLNGVALPGYMYLYYSNLFYYAYSRVTNQPVRQDYVIINSENFNSPTDIQVAEAVEGDEQTRIYTTSGVLMWEGTGRPQLPSGIYIMKRGDTTEKVKL